MRKSGLQANSKFFGDNIGPCFGLGYCLEVAKKNPTMNIKESVLAMP